MIPIKVITKKYAVPTISRALVKLILFISFGFDRLKIKCFFGLNYDFRHVYNIIRQKYSPLRCTGEYPKSHK